MFVLLCATLFFFYLGYADYLCLQLLLPSLLAWNAQTGTNLKLFNWYRYRTIKHSIVSICAQPSHSPTVSSWRGSCMRHRQRTQAYLKPGNEICNMLISLLSFDGGIGRRGGLGLYYHTLSREAWRQGRTGTWKEKQVMMGDSEASV